MRSIGLLLCLTACTLDNPAFTVSASEGGTAGATTESTGSTTGTSAPTTSGATSTVGTTAVDTGVTSDGATSMNVSDTAATTGQPGTTTTTGEATLTEPMTTATSESSESDTDAVTCPALDDPLGPFLPLLALPDHTAIATDTCAQWQQITFNGRLVADNNGLSVVADPDCMPANLPIQGFHLPVPLVKAPVAKGACVGLRFVVHPDYEECTIAEFNISHLGQLSIWGRFGGSPLQLETPVPVGFQPLGECECPGCCGQAPDPDVYAFNTAMKTVMEGQTAEFNFENKKFAFTNLRSHVHAPDCTDAELAPADWLHFDWLALQFP